MRRRGKTPWYHDFRKRLRFEQAVSSAYPSLRPTKVGKGWKAQYVYTVSIDVPDFERRRATLVFEATSEVRTPTIYADGPEQSPHRYRGGILCVWEPTDPDERRWVPADGLQALIGMVAVHLFKEAWWRETGEWLGDEHVHEPNKEAA